MKEMGGEKKAKVFYAEDGEEESKNETGELDDDFWWLIKWSLLFSKVALLVSIAYDLFVD